MTATPPDAYRPEATAHLRDPWDGAHCEGVDMSTIGRTPAQIRDLKLRCVGGAGCPRLLRCGQWGIGLKGREDPEETVAGMTREERIRVRRIINARRIAAKETAA